jgi:hypothetical protein
MIPVHRRENFPAARQLKQRVQNGQYATYTIHNIHDPGWNERYANAGRSSFNECFDLYNIFPG